MLDPKTYEHPDPEDPHWPWKPGDSVEGNRPHPYEAEPVLGGLKRRPGESREEYERRIEKGEHRAQYRLPDEGELDPYELEERYNPDEPEASDPWDYERGGPGSSRHPRGGYGHSSDEVDHSGESHEQRKERKRLGKRKKYLDRLPWSAEVADEMKKWEADVKAAGLSPSRLQEQAEPLNEEAFTLAALGAAILTLLESKVGRKVITTILDKIADLGETLAQGDDYILDKLSPGAEVPPFLQTHQAWGTGSIQADALSDFIKGLNDEDAGLLAQVITDTAAEE